MSVTFTGLASGIDTASLVDSIIEVERAPITLLEDKQEYLETKLDSYTEFNSLLESLNMAVISLNDQSDLDSYQVTNNGSEYFSVSTTSLTDSGSYNIEVVSLAERQKDISNEGVGDTDTTTLSGELQIGDQVLNYDNVTLSELVGYFDNGDYGVSASIVNDGTENGYRLVLTADTAGEKIEIVGTGDISIDTASNGHTVSGSKAHAIIDGIDFYSSNNTLTSAIHGTRITLMDVSDAGADRLTITADNETVIATALEDIVSAYNGMNEYVDTISDSDPTLANSMRSVCRRVKDFLTGSALVSLGISSNYETGELSFDNDILSEAYENDAEGVISSLLGDTENTGIMNRFDEYMAELVDGSSGFLAIKESLINKQLERMDTSIEQMETRLEKRRETLNAQFTAMETLISSLNSQADYLENYFSSDSSS